MKLQPLIVGIDPGQGGGVSYFSPDKKIVHVIKMPETEKDIVDALSNPDDDSVIVLVMIEAVHSMPGQGVASSFKFGRGYGFLRGVITALEIPLEQVTPQKWQKVMECRTHGDKNISKARAQQMWPKLRITHATADALLIGEYARRQYILTSR